MVNSNFSFSQNVKMGQGRELPGKPLEPWFVFQIQDQSIFPPTAHVCEFITEHSLNLTVKLWASSFHKDC